MQHAIELSNSSLNSFQLAIPKIEIHPLFLYLYVGL